MVTPPAPWTILVASKNKEDLIKNEGIGVISTILPLKVYGDFPDAQGQLTHKSLVGSFRISNSSKLFMVVLVTR